MNAISENAVIIILTVNVVLFILLFIVFRLRMSSNEELMVYIADKSQKGVEKRIDAKALIVEALVLKQGEAQMLEIKAILRASQENHLAVNLRFDQSTEIGVTLNKLVEQNKNAV